MQIYELLHKFTKRNLAKLSYERAKMQKFALKGRNNAKNVQNALQDLAKRITFLKYRGEDWAQRAVWRAEKVRRFIGILYLILPIAGLK